LKRIHKAGVLHGDIRYENLCLKNSGETFIIDFTHGKKNPSMKAKEWELNRMRTLLGMEETHVRRSSRLMDKQKRERTAGHG
jgi:tRNA A-37 threonylcarbamoyl transferase component Bud32